MPLLAAAAFLTSALSLSHKKSATLRKARHSRLSSQCLCACLQAQLAEATAGQVEGEAGTQQALRELEGQNAELRAQLEVAGEEKEGDAGELEQLQVRCWLVSKRLTCAVWPA